MQVKLTCLALGVLIAGCADDLGAELGRAALRVSVAQIPLGVASVRVEAVRDATGALVERAPQLDPDAALTVYFDALEAGHYSLRVRGLDASGQPRWCAGREHVELAQGGVAVAIELAGVDARSCATASPPAQEDAGPPTPEENVGGQPERPDEVDPPEMEHPEAG